MCELTKFEGDRNFIDSNPSPKSNLTVLHQSKKFFESLPNWELNSINTFNYLANNFEVDQDNLRDVLNQSIYEPFFISHQTIFSFSFMEDSSQSLISLADIIKVFESQTSSKTATYYFVSRECDFKTEQSLELLSSKDKMFGSMPLIPQQPEK